MPFETQKIEFSQNSPFKTNDEECQLVRLNFINLFIYSEARRTHANSIDTTALDYIGTLAAVHANHVLLLALGSTQRVFGVAFALALDAVATALGAVHVATLVLLLLAVLAFVVGAALAFVAAFAVTVR